MLFDILSLQLLLARNDGTVIGNSCGDRLTHGKRYWVRPITGPIKDNTLVIVVAKRSWMGSKKRLIRNFIIEG